jgi:enamine deaminase RidA (YjgF/YER057c/UK114 family)
MTLECINPDDLPTPEMYTQVVVATGSKFVFISGQQPEDIHGKLVGHGDFAAQARLPFGNLGRALAAAGPRKSARSRSTSSTTIAMNTCRPSKRHS